MNTGATIYLLFQLLLLLWLLLPVILYCLSRFRSGVGIKKAAVCQRDYAIIVTAYEQTDLLPAVVDSILQIEYADYLVYVVADKCDISNLHFDRDKVILLRPEHTLASNTRSHFYAIHHFRRDHDILTIIDSDNLVHPEYINELNRYFEQGFEAVQGIREAKNLNTTYACLDAARDIYYHFYDGEILFRLGSSATLAGSGMAFTTNLYKECLGHLDITGAGFDKVLQAEIIKRNKRIAFAEKAIVYDEKTTHSGQLVNQRSRWINTWFKYFGYGFTLIAKGIKKRSVNQLIFGIVLLRPPLFIFLLLSLLCLLIDCWIAPVMAVVFFLSFGCFIASFFIALKKSGTEKKIYRSLLYIPKFMFYQVLSLMKIRNANKRSVATKHSYATEATDKKSS